MFSTSNGNYEHISYSRSIEKLERILEEQNILWEKFHLDKLAPL